MPNTLPDFLEMHLSQGESQISHMLNPSWLLDSFQSDKWRIKIPGQSRLINEKWHGVHTCHWRFRLPEGCLTDVKWRTLLLHCKLMTLAHLECTESHSSSSYHLQFFQRKLLWLAEHIVIHYPHDTELQGLASVDNQKMIKFLVDYRESSLAGTGQWKARWDTFLRNKIHCVRIRIEVDSWFNTLSVTQRTLIDAYQRPIRILDNQKMEPLPKTGLSTDELVFIRRWLAMQGWFDKQGCVPLSKVTKAINIDNGRLNNGARLQYYLRLFEICGDYRFQEFSKYSHREYLSHRYCSIAQQVMMGGAASQGDVFSFFTCIRDYSPYIEGLETSPLSQLDINRLSPELCNSENKRTPTIPLDTALFLYDRLIEWALTITIPLLGYYQKLLDIVMIKQGHLRRYCPKGADNKEVNRQNCPWEKAFSACPPPVSLEGLRLWRVAPFLYEFRSKSGKQSDDSSIIFQIRNQGLTLLDAIYINTAVLTALIAVFTLRRHNEAINLHKDCLVQYQGRTYLDCNLEKFVIDGIRAPILRPIPRFLYDALNTQVKFVEALTHSQQPDKHICERLLVIPSYTGSKLLNSSILNASLDLFCDWIEVPLNSQGRRWYLRLHECRRFGAMSFFHLSGMEASLPALSWLMGHKKITDTWHYIQEELTGKEITQVEVALTHAALFNSQSTGCAKNIEQLTAVVQKYFGSDSLDLIDPDELDSYLEMLLEEGVFYVIPHTVQTTNGIKHVILVEIAEERITCQD